MDESIKYYTLTESGEGFYKEKGSKFYGFAFPVKDDLDIKERLDELRKKYYDARHHCFAFRLGLNQPIIRANDDGEPNHSAGDPILGQIRSYQLTNVLVVVVRYFGGTKLGVGGLIHAYKTAAEDALKNLSTEEVFEQERFQIRYSYEETPAVERLLQQFEFYKLDRVFQESCILTANIRKGNRKQLEAAIIDLQLRLEWLET